MILNKYNEIMDRVTIDPEMKSRVMSAVSTAIREQAEGAAIVTEIHSGENSEYTKTRTGKKAKRTPIVVISSIAAAVVVLLGALFIFKLMSSGSAKYAEATKNNLTVDGANFAAAQQTEAALEMEETTSQLTLGYNDEAPQAGAERGGDGTDSGNNYYSVDTTSKGSTEDADLDMKNVTVDISTDGTKDDRVSNIGAALPFDLKGNGTGKLADGIITEVFLGEGGEKVVLYTADEGTNLVKNFDPSNKSAGQDAVSPMGTQVKLYRLAFGNVTDPVNGEASTEVNAALFTKNGNTYLLVFSDIQTVDIILGVVDAV